VGLTERIARACAARPGRTFAAWGVVLLASIAAIVTLMAGLTTDAVVTGNPESAQAHRLFHNSFPPDPKREVTDVIVVRSDSLTVDSPEFRRVVDQLERDARNSGALVSSRTYYGTGDRTLVSRDRHATLIPVFVVDDSRVDDVLAILDKAGNGEFTATITGNNTVDNDFNKLSERDLQEGELKFGLPAALIILLLVFGTVVAGVIPLLMAIVSIIVALGLVAVLSQQFELSIFIVNMLTGMGLALGIDYSLFVISRYREERGGGRTPDGAIAAAGATASRAVLFSGSAFVVAMLGMLIVPTTIMRSLAAGAILVGIVSVAAALTLLPALLGVLRDGVDRLRIPYFGRRSVERDNPEGRFWGAIIDRVLRRPWLSLVLATALLLAAAIPAFGLHIGASGVSTLPDDLAAKQGYDALQRDFPAQSTDPVFIVASGSSADTRRRLEALRQRLAADPRFGRGEVRVGNGATVLAVPVRGDEVSDTAVSAVRDVRNRLVPETFAGTNADVHVGGSTSENVDYFDAVTNPAPLVFAFVLGLTLVLLTVAFRSIVVALSAIALNLLSVGAAYGLLVLVFLHGYGTDLLGFQQVESIDAWVPLFLFSVLFGLSMDYQVFLLSRIRERYDRTRDTRDAVRSGVASTARIITGAALIIVAVFSGFARGDLVMFQQMGFGVAVALLIDATIIRSVLLPSLMAVLGEWNWYLPRWLEWMPHLEVEGHTAPSRPELSGTS
jgi:RND superfamily putative drug exporter